MKHILLISLCSLLVVQCATKQEVPLDEKQAQQNLEDAARQYLVMRDLLGPEEFPKTFENGNLVTSNSGWWCSGFYPGSLLYLFEATGDTALYLEAVRILKVLEKEQYNTTTHDLGFMMYSSFGALNRLNPTSEYRQILINSASSLITRFNPTVGCIKSWDSKPEDFLVIIDNMMNLELLFWATQETGDSTYYKVAVTHANTTLQHHFREDNSSYHVLNYSPETGEVKQKRTAQGFADESAWARGQAWGLYGYVSTYRWTKNEKYLEQSRKIASFLLGHPNLPEDGIPYWDFNAPEIPDALRDASAGAIIASALLELCEYIEGEEADTYTAMAETILTSLSSDAYRNGAGSFGGFILRHGVGHKPAGTEIDIPLTYTDYYFIEASMRYLKE